MHTGFAPTTYHEPNKLDSNLVDPTQPNQTQLIMWKAHATHDHEHSYHDSLHSGEVAQLYPQVGDFITS
jgi:hypothetical protein